MTAHIRTPLKTVPPRAKPAPTGTLQRKCACGQHTGGGTCDRCRKQSKLTMASPGDIFEREADRLAESVADGRPAQVLRKVGGGSRSDEPEEVPAAVDAALRDSGHPVSPAVRGFMESRLGHDFSRVRVHTGEIAARSARSVNALAFTVGSDIVFGSGQYAPETAAGRKLLAHELTHVVQQGESGEATTVRRSVSGFFSAIFRTIFGFGFKDDTIKDYLKKLEKDGKIEDDFDSDLKARQVVRDRNKYGPLSVKIMTLLVREMLTGHVGGGDESATIELFRSIKDRPQERTAVRNAIGRDQLWGAFGGRNRNIIEALTAEANDLPAIRERLRGLSESRLKEYYDNVVDPAVKAEVDTLLRQKRHELGSYPEAERRRISVGGEFSRQSAEAFEADFKEEPVQDAPRTSNPLPGGGALGSYSTRTVSGSQREEIPLPPQVKLEFETRIAKQNRAGLQRIAAHMIRDQHLRLNLTRTLTIQAAGKIYRFTRFEHQGTGEGGAATTELVLIEEVGALPPTKDVEAQTWNTNQARPGSLPTEKFKVRTFDFQRDKDWLADEWEAVLTTLRAFPDSVLAVAGGLTFKRLPCREEEIQNGICGPKPANVDAARRTGGTVASESITFYNEAFATSPTRSGLSTILVKTIAHEIGHQLDLQPLDLAVDTYNQGIEKARTTLEQALNEPEKKGKKSKKGEPSKADQALEAYDKEKARLDEALARARSRSGIFSQVQGSERVQSDVPGPERGDFLTAAMKDGLVLNGERITPQTSISAYAERNIREQFADLFALYFTDPTLLKAIRPNVYQYFATQFPGGTP